MTFVLMVTCCAVLVYFGNGLGWVGWVGRVGIAFVGPDVLLNIGEEANVPMLSYKKENAL